MSSDSLTIISSDIEPSLKVLSKEHIQEFFRSYGLSMIDIDQNKILEILSDISHKCSTFIYLREVILSDRQPYTIMILASKIGMYIPLSKRFGINTYEFYITNVRYYEKIITRNTEKLKIPSLYDIYMVKDRISFLLQYRDDEIIKPEYVFSDNYNTRIEMLNIFIKNNVNIYGNFRLECNFRSVYNNDIKLITYYNDKLTINYTTNELLDLFDLEYNKLWSCDYGYKNKDKKYAFNYLCLHMLRQIILEQLHKWNKMDYNYTIDKSNHLFQIFEHLDRILDKEIKNDISAYLGEHNIK